MLNKYFLVILLFFSLFLEARDTFFVPSRSEEVDRLLKTALEHTKNKQWVEAVNTYHKLIEKHGKNVTLYHRKLYRNVRDVVLERLQKLPPEALKTYKTLIDKKASRAARSSEQSPKDLHLLAQKYPYTKTGTDAIIQLIDQYVAQEKYQQAIIHIKQFLKSDIVANTHYYQALVARLALCYFALGYDQKLNDLKNLVIKKRFAKKINIGGKNQLLISYIYNLQKTIKSRFLALNQESQWSTLGKNENRNFRVRNSLPFFRNNFSSYIPKPTRSAKKRYYYNEPPRIFHDITPYYPVVADNTIFINNGKDVFAYSLLSSRSKMAF